MCMLMTINPNVGHVTTSSESSFVSSASKWYPHNWLQIQRSFRTCPVTMYVLVCLWIGLLACMMFSFICCPLNCVMIARRNEHGLENIWVWQLHHSVIGHHLNVLHAFLEGIEIFVNGYQEEFTLSSVAECAFSRTPKRLLHPFSHERIFFAWKDQKGNKKKTLNSITSLHLLDLNLELSSLINDSERAASLQSAVCTDRQHWAFRKMLSWRKIFARFCKDNTFLWKSSYLWYVFFVFTNTLMGKQPENGLKIKKILKTESLA